MIQIADGQHLMTGKYEWPLKSEGLSKIAAKN